MNLKFQTLVSSSAISLCEHMLSDFAHTTWSSVSAIDMLQAHVGAMWLKLLPSCTYVVKETEENAAIKIGLIFLHIQHSSKEDGKG